jgi:hypothetical protein
MDSELARHASSEPAHKRSVKVKLLDFVIEVRIEFELFVQA